MSSDVSSRRERRLRLALGLNLGIVVLQVIAGLAASSLGLLADAGHNLTDVAAIVVSLFAVRMARRPATSSRSFGFHRGTTLAAQLNAASILVVCVVVAIESIRRLGEPTHVAGGVVVVVALVGAVVNFGAAWALGGDDHAHGGGDGRDLNMRSALIHMVGDGVASIGVAAAGVVILITGGWDWLDPLASLGISVLIGVQGWKLLRETAEVLLEATPAGLDVPALSASMAAVDGVEAVHDLHVWTLSSDVRALSAHVVLEGHPSLEEAQVVGNWVKSTIALPYRIAHATLELECEACGPPEDRCAIETVAPTAHDHGAHDDGSHH
ncbi:MAG: cation diffusion facilitator family transporter [Acidimicrobiales bacterium]